MLLVRTIFYNMCLGLVALTIVLSSTLASAQTLPQSLNVSGGLFNASGTPITLPSVAFKLELLDKNAACVLYTEEHLAQNLAPSKGAFSLQLGGGTSPLNHLQGGTSFSHGLFLNSGATPPFTLCPAGVTFASGDSRLIRVSYNLGAGYVAMSPNVPIVSAAFAMVADTLRGLTPSDLVQVNGASAMLTQPNVENIFSNINYPKLDALLNGTSTQYLPTAPVAPVSMNNQRIVSVADPTGLQDAATKNYSDNNLGGKTIDSAGIGLGVGGGKTLVWDQILNKWVAQLPASFVGSVVAGSGLLGGTITSSGTLSVDTGTMANQIVQLTNLAYLPAVDAHLLTNIQFPVVSVNGKTGAVTLIPSDIAGFGTAALKDYGTAAGNLVELAGASRLPALDGFALSNLNAIYLQSRRLASTAPTTGQILTWNGSQWEPQAAPISGITDLYGDVVATGPGNVNATIVNDKITSAKINSSGNVANRLLITDATTGATVTYATCLAGEILKYNVVTGWGCAPDAGAAGSVTLVAAGAGLVAGTISSVGTLSVDVGVGAGQILQLNGSAQIPAVDGFLVSNVNAVKLQTRNVAATAPTANQVLRWNNSTAVWEPSSDTTGTVTQIVASTGLLGGTISATGTVSVDVGVSANKIVQLTAGAQYPAVDGNLIANINAVKIQGRDVSSAAPSSSQVLGWNGTTSVWEPLSAAVGSMTGVVSGTGLVPSTISSFGTLNVDVGVTANKVLQLNGSAQIPAVDGNLVTNVNAVKLQARDVASTAPGAGQILGYNATTSAWEPMTGNSGSLTGVVSGTGLIAGTVSSYGTINIDVGSTANKIVQLTPGAQYPQADGYLITNINAGSISGVGTVTSVNSGTGLLGGPFSTVGTLSVDVGTAANKILQLNGSAQIPAVDGNLVTNVNAVKLQARNVAATAPTADQVLRWNNSTSVWEPSNATTGTLTQIVASTGLLGGTISATGTVSVDVGVSANKIVQLTAGAQYPAVDGNLITNVNAVKLQARDVASTAPGAGQFLGYNATTSAWEPMTGNSGSLTGVVSGTGLIAGTVSSYGTINIDVGSTANKVVQLTSGAQYPQADGYLITNINAGSISGVGTVTSVNSGTGLLGGPFSTVGTLSVDVGTAANKILQLNGSAQYPAVDGNLITNVNAVKLQARDVAGTAPGDGQVLTWNNATLAWEPKAPGAGADNLGNHTASQNLAMTNFSVVGLNLGTAGAPSVSFNSDATTGVFSPAASTVAVSTGGSERLRVTSTGALGVGTNTPARRLHVSGTDGMRLEPTALPGSPAAGDIAIDSGASNTLKYYNGSAWVSSSGGTMTGVVSGTGLVASTISSYGTINIDVGSTANKIVQLTAGAQYPQADGYLITNINAGSISGVGTVTSVNSGTGLLGGPFSTIGTLSVDVGTAASKILQLNGSAQIPAVDGNLVTNVNAVKLQTRNVAATVPTADQVLRWNNSTSVWEPANASTGTITQIVASTGLLGGTISATGTVSIDVGVSANKIVQLTAGAQYPAVDGNLITNVNAVKLQARDVASTAPGAGQFLGYNATTSAWEPMTGNSGSLTGVVSGTGLVAGTVSSYGTINIDVGSTANKIVQLTAGAQYPQADGYLITNINSASISGVGTVTSVNSGTGLLGGPFSTVGTLSVDVGTTANKILQVTAGGQYPAVDGNLVTNVNAVKLQTRNVSNTAPGGGQFLGYNATISAWEAMTGSAGSLTGVVSGTGLIAGTISSYGTLNIDVGSTANKIVQLTAGAQYPQADGNLISNINAVKLQARNVAGTAPGDGQVLTWNNSSLVWEPKAPGAGADNLGNHTASQNLAMTNFSVVGLNLGTAGAPSVSFNSDATTGVFSPAASTVAISTGGSERLRVTSTGALGVGTNTPARRLHVSGTDGMRLDPTALPGSPAAGDIAIDSGASNTLKYYNGSAWVSSSGTMTGVVSGTGLIASTISSYGTINIDVGSTANKIVQITSGGQYPQADGFLVTNVNAVKLQGRNVAAVSPAVNQVLTWNGSQWEAKNAQASSNAFVNGGNNFGATTQLGTNDTQDLEILTNGSTKMTINQAGNIGIGTTTPVSRLEVRGTGGANFRVGDTTLSSYYSELQDTGTGGYLTKRALGNASLNINVISGAANNATVNLFNSTNTSGPRTLNLFVGDGSANVAHKFEQGTGNVSLAQLGGRVGIGTTSTPGAILDVNGTGTLLSAILVPRDSTSNRPAGVNGMIRYNSQTNKMETFENGAWTNVATGTVGTGDFMANGSVPMTGNFNAVAGSAALPGVSFVGDTDSGMFEPGANTLGFSTGGTQRMTIDSLGNVGIGTATPIARLHVEGDIRAQGINITNGTESAGISGNAWLYMNKASGSPAAFAEFRNTSTGVNSGGYFDFRSGTVTRARVTGAVGSGSGNRGYLRFETQVSGTLTEVMRIDQYAAVGIGTTGVQAGSVLDIYGTGTRHSSVLVPRDDIANRPYGVNGMIRYNSETNRLEGFENGQWGNISAATAGISASGTSGAIQYSNGSGVFASNNNLVIDGSNGRIGIGTTSPASKLDVAGDISATTIYGVNLFLAKSDAAAYTSSSGATNYAVVGPALEAYNQAPLDSSGSFLSLKSRNTNGNYQNAYIASISNTGAGVYAPSIVFGQSTGAAAYSERMRIDASGNVGVGTTNPGRQVHAYSAVSTYLRAERSAVGVGEVGLELFGGAGGTNWVLYQPTSSGDLRFYGGGGNDRVTIQNNTGFVGIGTTTPQAILDVRGTGTAQSAMIVPRDTLALRPGGVNGMIRYNTSTSKMEAFENNAWTNMIGAGTPSFPLLASPVGTAAAPAYSFTGDTNTGLYDVGVGTLGFATAGSARMVIDSTGAVGIGTTLPDSSHILDAAGIIRSTGSSGGVRTGYNCHNSSTSANSSGCGYNFYAGTVPRALVSGIAGTSSTGGHLSFSTRQSGTITETMRISESGYVGIGTTTPQAILDVRGTGTGYSAMIVPRDTTALRPGGVNGMIRYNSSTNRLEGFENGQWGNISVAMNGGGGGSSFVNGGNAFGGSATIGTNDDNSLSFLANGVTRATVSSASGFKFFGSWAGGYQASNAGGWDTNLDGIGVENTTSADNNGSQLELIARNTAGTDQRAYIGAVSNTAGYTPEIIFGHRSGAGTYDERVRIAASGMVGIGTSAPVQPLEVNGNMRLGSQTTRSTATSRGQLAQGSTYTVTVNANTTVDWNAGNIQELNTFLCNGAKTITMNNMVDGGAYTLLLSGTAVHSGTCLFAGTGLTFKTSGGNVAPTVSKDVLFTFVVVGGTVIFNMVDNLQ